MGLFRVTDWVTTRVSDFRSTNHEEIGFLKMKAEQGFSSSFCYYLMILQSKVCDNSVKSGIPISGKRSVRHYHLCAGILRTMCCRIFFNSIYVLFFRLIYIVSKSY